MLLEERGVTKQGNTIEEVTHFHGNITSLEYESQTDKITIQFCYRSETFTARNIQISYIAKGELSHYIPCICFLF